MLLWLLSLKLESPHNRREREQAQETTISQVSGETDAEEAAAGAAESRLGKIRKSFVLDFS